MRSSALEHHLAILGFRKICKETIIHYVLLSAINVGNTCLGRVYAVTMVKTRRGRNMEE